MKKNLLILLFGLFTFAAAAQTEKRSASQISIFPNPATEYITVNDDDAVHGIVMFNMVGRKIRTFDTEKNARYEIGDLPNGIYLIQLVGKNSKVLSTQRLTKKS